MTVIQIKQKPSKAQAPLASLKQVGLSILARGSRLAPFSGLISCLMMASRQAEKRSVWRPKAFASVASVLRRLTDPYSGGLRV